jgi:hypothetical protein
MSKHVEITKQLRVDLDVTLQKLADGWKYGPVKYPEKKEHPCMVPFAELPKEQQLKDALFRHIVPALTGP